MCGASARHGAITLDCRVDCQRTRFRRNRVLSRCANSPRERQQSPAPLGVPGEFAVTSPPAIVNGLVIVGSAIGDGRRAAAPSGVVRAFDARTGTLRWSWDPIARASTDAGYDTWIGPNGHTIGAANAWSIISVDAARDLVSAP